MGTVFEFVIVFGVLMGLAAAFLAFFGSVFSKIAEHAPEQNVVDEPSVNAASKPGSQPTNTARRGAANISHGPNPQ